MRSTLAFLFAAFLALVSGCSGGGGGGGTLGGIGNLPTDSPIPDASGTITDTIAPDKPVTVSAGNIGVGSPLSSLTSVDFPSGALSAPVTIKIFETSSIAKQIDATTIGATAIAEAGPAMVVSGDDSALQSSIMVHVPYQDTSALRFFLEGANYGVLAFFTSTKTMQIFTGNDIAMDGKTIDVKTTHFGAFQVIKITGTVTTNTIQSPLSANTLTPVAQAATTASTSKTSGTITSSDTSSSTSSSTQTSTATATTKKSCTDGTADGGTATRTRYQSSTVSYGSTCASESQTTACSDGVLGGWSGTYTYDSCAVAAPANCGNTGNGQQATRTKYQASTVLYGQTCTSESQKATCSNGTLGAWSGTYTYDSCSVSAPANCGNTLHGQQASRTKFQTSSVGFGQTCVSEIQNATCTNGALGTWNGSYTFDSCTVSAPGSCGSTASGQTASRTKYQAANVAYGQSCVSESQTATCSNGTLGTWSGTYTFDSCSAATPASCDGVAHGQTTSRTKYQAASVAYGQTCVSESQTATCNNGTLGAWSGTYTFDSCSVGAPASCGDTANGQTASRTKYQAPSVAFGSQCASETQTSTCNNGVFGAWSGSYTVDSCSVNQPTLLSMSINSGATYTKSQSVTLNFSVTSASQMYITNSLGCNADGSWENYTASKSWNLGQANNTATVYAKFKDAFGSETSCINSTIIHDNIAPTNASISINGGASYVTTTTVALSLTATGATEMYITNTAGCISDGTWESYATTRSWTIGQTNATATVYAKFRDAASNEGTCVSDTIIHDNTPPANTSISINSDAIFTTSSRPLALSFTATDINPIQMYVTNTSGCASGGNWENFTSSKSWDVGPICTSKCTGTAYVKFADAAGNESSCISDTITKVWLEINLPQQARYGIAATSVGTKAFFAGGHIYAPPYITNRIDIYDSSTNSWSTASLSQARYNAVAVTVGTKAIFAGGRTSDSGNAVTDRVDIYDSSTNSWSTASLSWSRDTLAATSVGTKAIFGPGIGVSGVQDTVDIYDSSNNTWSQTTIPQTGYGMAATSVGAKAIFAGGSPSGNAVNIYDPSTNSWSTTILSQSRTYLAAVTVGTKAIFAGGNNGSSASNRVDIYDSTTNSWSTTTLSVARENLAAIATGTKAVFAGGFASSASNVVDIYDSSANSWSTATLYDARNYLASTSVGTKAFFAGGMSSSSYPSYTIDIYDP